MLRLDFNDERLCLEHHRPVFICQTIYKQNKMHIKILFLAQKHNRVLKFQNLLWYILNKGVTTNIIVNFLICKGIAYVASSIYEYSQLNNATVISGMCHST